MRDNDAGLGSPPGAAAHQGMPGAGGEVVAAARSSRSRTRPRRALRCVSAREFRAKFCGEGVVVRHEAGTSAPYPGERVQLGRVGFSSCPCWGTWQEVVPARVIEICQKSEGTFR